MQAVYREIVSSKTGFKIPVLRNGKTIESRYNPKIDAERKIKSMEKIGGFYLVIGLGSGLFVSSLLDADKTARILVVENSIEDINFLRQIPSAEKLIETAFGKTDSKTTFESDFENGNTDENVTNKINGNGLKDTVENEKKTSLCFENTDSIPNRLKICVKEDLEKTLADFYIPALFGNLNIIEQPNYLSAVPEAEKSVKTQIDSGVKTIMADFSVQAHFGKIWQRNIMENLFLYSKFSLDFPFDFPIDFPTEKEAVILAAGPTLDAFFEGKQTEEFSELLTKSEVLGSSLNRENCFLIATDTAFSSALKRGFAPDVVISIDGQLVSDNHFLHKTPQKTLFVFDLCANPSAVRKAAKSSNRVSFAEGGHPLAKLASKSGSDCFSSLFSGAGTVTISAVDFALKAGFKKIRIVGADFAYTNGKTYVRGTYLDNLYNMNSLRVSTSETLFSKLMYRTELMAEKKGKSTTPVLNSYKKSLEEYLSAKNVAFRKEGDAWILFVGMGGTASGENSAKIALGKNNSAKTASISQKPFPSFSLQAQKKHCFSYSGFYKSISDFQKEIDLSKINYSHPMIVSVLPYIAFLRFKNAASTLPEMVKLALINLLRYEEGYEKK